MNLKDALISEVKEELASTRKVVARLPASDWAYKPHEKSWEMGGLASHLINVVEWGSMVLREDVTKFSPEFRPWVGKSPEELLAKLEKNATELLGHVRDIDESKLDQTWRLMLGEQEVMAIPRYKALRTFVLNHLIHHRAQLTVYLRLRQVPVPAIYGPSADEQVTFT